MFSQNTVWQGLGTYSFDVPNDGIYSFRCKMQIPTLVSGSGANSAVVATVSKNTVAQYTGTAGAQGFETSFLCAAGDTIDIAFTSAAAVDAAYNAIKAEISVSQDM